MPFFKALPIAALALAFTACGEGPEWTRNAGDELPRVGPEAMEPEPDPQPSTRPPVWRSPGDGAPEPGEVVGNSDGLTVTDIWGEGIVVEIDQLAWAAQGEIRFRVGLTEADSGKPAPPLSAEHFAFAEDGVKLGTEALYEVSRAKDLQVVLVLDMSQSIVEADALEDVRAGARALFDTLPREAEVALVGFSTEYELLTPFTDDADQVHSVLDDLAPRSGRAGQFTNLWGAVDFATGLFNTQTDAGKVMVVFTDGRDNVAEARLAEAIDAAAEVGASTFAIGLGADFDESGLTRLAGPGHVSSTRDAGALVTMFRDIATQIGERLTVTYVTPKASGKHTLEVSIGYGNKSGGFDIEFDLGE